MNVEFATLVFQSSRSPPKGATRPRGGSYSRRLSFDGNTQEFPSILELGRYRFIHAWCSSLFVTRNIPSGTSKTFIGPTTHHHVLPAMGTCSQFGAPDLYARAICSMVLLDPCYSEMSRPMCNPLTRFSPTTCPIE